MTPTVPEQSQEKDEESQDDVRIRYDIGFRSGFFSRQPVHEHMTIASLLRSKIPFRQSTTYDTLDCQQWEYFRGLIWNDDPSCLLFVDDAVSNHRWGWGLEWLRAYENSSVNSMTRRSHWGDLQFLHSMASADGEDPYTTRKNILDWFEVIYKIAIGDAESISPDRKLSAVFPLLFNDSTTPSGDGTVTDLLIATTPKYKDYDLSKRALGSCIHMIQDSYAIGHTQRRLLNPWDLDRDAAGFFTFKPGTFGLWGDVLCFHNYSSQDKTRHTHYDGLEGEPVPNPQDLDSFNHIVGARNAIIACTRLLNFAEAKTRWEDGTHAFLRDEVFGLHELVRPSDGQVDPEIGTPSVRKSDANLVALPRRQDSITDNEKLGLLEAGRLYEDCEPPSLVRRPGRDRWRMRVGQMRVVFLVIFLLYGYRAWLDCDLE